MGERRKPVLIIQHAPQEHPAVIRRALECQGIVTSWIHPYRGEYYPEIRELSGLISLGGPMGANDEDKHPWIPTEIALIRACVESGLPVTGICLGGQLMARAMGGRVEPNEFHEVGWFPIEVTPEGLKDPIVGAAGSTPTVYQWHQDTFHLPPGARLLARSKACPRQAYRLGEKAYGFQFHPEADHQLVGEWLSCDEIEQDIAIARKASGARTVQNIKTQLERAAQGEKASLKITAGIGSLFRKISCRGHQSASREQIERWATHRIRLVVEFEGSDRKPARLRGTIQALLSVTAGDFVIFKDESTLQWPIRVTDLTRIEPSE